MIYQYAFNINEITEFNEVADFCKLISDERKDKIHKFRFDKDKIHSLFAEVILRYALDKIYGLRDIVISQTGQGKPYLSDKEDISFNMSHSGDWVLCVVGDTNVGIDVEQINDMDILSVAEGFFTGEESGYLLGLNESDRLEEFYKIWTLKESYLKNIGEGLNIPLDSFMFKQEGEYIKIYNQGEKDDNYSFYTRSLDESHYMSLCVTGECDSIADVNSEIITLQELVLWKNNN